MNCLYYFRLNVTSLIIKPQYVAKSNENVVPTLRWLETRMALLCNSIIFFVIAKPNPAPPVDRARLFSTR